MFKTLKAIGEVGVMCGAVALAVVGGRALNEYRTAPEPLFTDVTPTGQQSCEMTGLNRSAINIYAHNTEGGKRLVEVSSVLRRDFTQPGNGTSPTIKPGETGTYRADNQAILTSETGIGQVDGGRTTIIITDWQNAAPVGKCLFEARNVNKNAAPKVTEASVILKNDYGL